MARTVALVFAPDYSSELEKLAFRVPVWIVDTPENHAAAEAAWGAAVEWPHITVTLFRPSDGHPTRDDWRALLDQVSLHERFDALEVIGEPLTIAARAAMREGGFDRVEETKEGFRARRM